MINGPEELPASGERLNGYLEGVRKRKLKIDMRLIERTDLSRESTQQALDKLLNLKHPPDAIISFNDYVHMDAVQYAQQRKIRINKDIAFVSYANLPITGYTAFPPLVSIEQYPYRQGQKAMGMMIRVLTDKKENDGHAGDSYVEEIETTLVVRDRNT
jgi:DNA-binding LacI/PurR family transcriptional regulator